MDDRVNDFLNEINEIAPLNESENDNVWEKCLDEDSGYYYYWNTKTNEVTWDIPPDYKCNNKSRTKKTSGLYIPPRTAPLFPSTSGLLAPVSEAIKIYKIGEFSDSITKSSKPIKKEERNKKEDTKVIPTKVLKRHSSSDDEKIILISSYGEDSESEDEKPQKANGSSEHPHADNESSDIAQKSTTNLTDIPNIKSPFKSISGISLIAGYSDSEEESDVEVSGSKGFVIASTPPECKLSHSTLFPVPEPIDVKDFEEAPKSPKEGEDFDSKAFQRKRRIGVALVNTSKKPKGDEIERKGLGFEGGSGYPGFKSGGVMFVKADVLNDASSTEEGERSGKVPEEIADTYGTLKEKLGFLSEGRETVSPVQAMLIQIETLYTAVKTGDLKHNYLKKWLDETCSDLIKLEKETTPDGWLLQWDRSHKRYYYQNEATGESQWEYPQPDVTRRDEAMDICTTPPPNGEAPIHMSPPLPPVISSPSPPPPPTISDLKTAKKKDIPLPPEPISNLEPLPPGVEAADDTTKTKTNSDMNDVLNSFYSDLAAIESNSNSPPMHNTSEDPKLEPEAENYHDPSKKKKKTKVKLAQGISMKKKGVSKLVEKWKSVQMSYND